MVRKQPITVRVSDSYIHRLNHSHLPETKHVRLLVTHYFQNFHPLRCFGFVHKPTFLRRLDDELLADPEKSPLLHIMCTLGAQYVFSHMEIAY